MYSSVKFIFGLIVLVGATTAQQYCQAGYTGPASTGKCYRIMPGVTSPSDANKLCKDNGGSLGTIKNQVEQDFFQTYVLPSAQDWLITGLWKVPAVTGSWTWPDGSIAGGPGVTTPYSNWGNPSSNPAIANLNNYMYIYSHPNQKNTANYGKWWADQQVSHEVLCEAFARNNGNCGYEQAAIVNNPCVNSCSRY